MPRAGLWSTLTLLAVLSAGSAKAATVWLSIPEGADPCSFDQLAAALRSRLPDVRVEPGTYDLDSGDVAVALHRDVDGWSVVVHAAGEHELRRKLPPVGVDCVGLAQTLAFMVERYLGEVQWTGAPVVVEPVHPQPATGSRWQATAELGVAGSLNPSTSASSTLGFNPALDLDLGARKGHWELGVSLAAEPSQLAAGQNSTQTFGEIQYVPATLQLLEGYRLKLGPGSLRLELMPGAQLVWASISHAAGTSQATFTVGARIAWELPIYRRLFASLRVSGRVIVPEIFILIGELPAQPYVSGYGAADASLSLGYLFF